MVGHAGEHFTYVGWGEVEAAALVKVRDFCLRCSRGKVWHLPGLGVVRRDNLDGLDAVSMSTGTPNS
jgi:hypothetical protein